MNPKYAAHLFTELVIMSNEDKEHYNEIMHELIGRLLFCGFDLEVAHAIIKLEKIFINFRNLKFEKKLYDTYWWIDNIKEKKLKSLFDDNINENLFYLNSELNNTGKFNNKILTFGEIISLEDEATYINMYIKEINSKKNKQVKKEVDFFKSCSDDDCKHRVLKDIKTRFLAAYEEVHKTNNFPKDYINKAVSFYLNEMNILFNCKWIYKEMWQYNNPKMIWHSYTEEYYKREK